MPWWQGAPKSHDTLFTPDNAKSGFFSSRRHRLLSRAKKSMQPVDVGSPSDHFRNTSARPAATPQPLPLPERDPKFASTSASFPLPSPEIIKEREGETAEAANAEAIDGNKRRSVGQESRRNSENIETNPSKNSYSSAPCSPYSNMVESSPQRNNPSPIGLFQVWSAPELPHPEYSHNYSKHSSSNHNTATSLDTCPLHSPTLTVHPLPLPPPLSMPTSTPSSLPWQSPPVSKNDSPATATHNITTSQPSPVSPVDPIPTKSTWQKGKLIGRGTFGSVYVASNRETGALCAMKEVDILPDDSKSAECMRQLEQEIKVLSRLKHPNIVQYYGSEIVSNSANSLVGDKFYIYLEYVHPGSINKFIHDHCGAITESVVRNFTRHILFGLAYLHAQKTIHRDIKGANLLVDAFGVVKLADFGMAKHLNGQASNLSLKGSPYWMAPELLQSKLQIDASCDIALAVDIWSLGCTIIEMMNGKPPWSEYEGPAALFKVLKESPPIPEIMSAEGKDFLECCFRRNPAERPSARSLLDHPFLNISLDASNLNHTSTNLGINKDSMQLLRERNMYKPLETAQNNNGKLYNNLSLASYDSFTPPRISNAAITKNPT